LLGMVNELMEALKGKGFKVSLNPATMEHPTKHLVVARDVESKNHQESIKVATESREFIHDAITKYLGRAKEPVGLISFQEQHLTLGKRKKTILELRAIIELDRSREFSKSIEKLYRNANRP
jgi:hypothetical protein